MSLEELTKENIILKAQIKELEEKLQKSEDNSFFFIQMSGSLYVILNLSI